MSSDYEVWVASSRRTITYHWLSTPDRTICGRSTRTGEVVPLGFVRDDLAGEECPRCRRALDDAPSGQR